MNIMKVNKYCYFHEKRDFSSTFGIITHNHTHTYITTYLGCNKANFYHLIVHIMSVYSSLLQHKVSI